MSESACCHRSSSGMVSRVTSSGTERIVETGEDGTSAVAESNMVLLPSLVKPGKISTGRERICFASEGMEVEEKTLSASTAAVMPKR